MSDLSPEIRQVISDRIKATEGMTGDFEQDQAKGFFQEFKPTEYDFGIKGQGDAIQRKAMQKFYDPVIANLQTQQRADYAGKVQSQMRNAQQIALGQMRYDNARMLAARQRLAQEEAQRAAMIGSLFQVAGIGVGAMLGGPAGAAAGSQLGSVAGESAGGGPAFDARMASTGNIASNRMGHSGPYMRG